MGKIIIYSYSIKKAEKLAKKLNCPTYYNNMDTVIGKVARIKEWLKKRRIIIIINILGIGINIPNI